MCSSQANRVSYVQKRDDLIQRLTSLGNYRTRQEQGPRYLAMKCANCSFENPGDARFCENCGKSLEITCPNCRKPVSPGARFCKSCGYTLHAEPAVLTPTAPSRATTSPQALINRFVTKEIASKIAAALIGSVEGERRIVTILFADIKGSTAMAEKLDPEDWAEIMNRAFEFLIEPIYRYEGIVARLMGDAILAFFGAPVAHEDDPQRAVLAALAILDGMDRYREKLQSEQGLDFGVRIGLNTGLVVVGNIGTDLKSEYTAMGDAINLASRMQTAAEPNTILISESTHRLIAPLFEFEDCGKVAVKGKEEPIQTFRPISERKGVKQTRGIAGLTSPMVGRQREFSTLMRVISDAHMGRGSIVAVIGEAGLGKSRLIAEWRKAAFTETDPPVRWIEGRCLSYASSIAHYLSREILRALIGSPAGSSEEETHAALRHTLDSLATDGIEIYPFLGHLLGLRLEDEAAAHVKYLEGPALQAQYVAAYKRLLQGLSHAAPIVIVCEDIHWADPSSIELCSQITSIAATAPVAFVFITRNDQTSPGWRLIERAREIAAIGSIELYLAPLSENDSRQLINNLLNIEALPESLRRLVLAKAEGNPFFVEEVLRMLIDRGGIAFQAGQWTVTHEISNLEIPDTLQGVLTARIDQLPEVEKHTLQIAAVIGRKFNVKVLERVLEMQGAREQERTLSLERQLAQLEAAQLVRRTNDIDPIYIFKHALTQETAYATLLKQSRRKIHLQVAESMEQTYSDQLDEYAPLLAQHYAEAGNEVKALEFSVRAGDVATRVHANIEALTHYTRALDLARRDPDANSQLLYDLLSRRGRAFELSSQFKAALDYYEEMEALARTRGDHRLELAALAAQCQIRCTPNPEYNPDLGEELAHRTAQLARELEDRAVEAKIYWDLLNLYRLTRRLADARAAGEKSAAIARELNLREQLAFTLNDTAHVYTFSGEFDRARITTEEATRLWRELDNLPMLADSLGSIALNGIFYGDYQTTLQASEEALRISRSIGNLWGQCFSLSNVGIVYWEYGEPGRAIEAMEETLRLSDLSGYLIPQVINRADLAIVHANLGATSHGIELAKRALEFAVAHYAAFSPYAAAALVKILVLAGKLKQAASLMKSYEGNEHNYDPLFSAYITFGKLYLAIAQNDYAGVLNLAPAFLSRLRTFGMHLLIPETLLILARAQRALGQVEAAGESLEQGRVEAETLGARWELWQILGALAEIETERGNPRAADTFRDQARDIVVHIAERVPQPSLRDSFLATVQVRKIIGGG